MLVMGLVMQLLYWPIQPDYLFLRQCYLQTASKPSTQRHDSEMEDQPYSLTLAQLEALAVVAGREKLLG